VPRIDSEKFYKNAIKKYGISPQGVCWIDAARQQMRFDILHSFLPNDLSSSSIVDAGCGFGDFYIFLKKYRGIDAVSEMCSLAKEQTHQEIIEADILHAALPVADYYLCSGAMNILTPFETTLFIRKCFQASKKGFIFNILYGNRKNQTYNYLTKESLENIAKELGVKKIKRRDDYLENDITMGFFR